MVTWAILAANVLVFVLFQGLGTNARFTYAFSTVPAEIVSGQDVVTDDQIAEDPCPATASRFPACSPHRAASTSPC